MNFRVILIIVLFIFSGEAYSDNCPRNFIDILEGKKDTKLYKKHIADLCRGHEVIVKGKVLDIDRNGDGYELSIDSIPGSRVFEIEMLKNPGANMLAIKKDDVVIVKGKLMRFGGYINAYIYLNGGACVKCN